MFLMFCAAGSRKEVGCCISCEIILAIFCSYQVPFKFRFFSNAIGTTLFQTEPNTKSQCPFLTPRTCWRQRISLKFVVKLQHSKFSVLQYDEPNNDLVSVLNLSRCQFYFIQLIIDVIHTLEQFCVDGPMFFLIAQIFRDSVATTIHILIAVGDVGKQFLCFRHNTWVWILVTFSTSLDRRLHKFIETFNWNQV